VKSKQALKSSVALDIMVQKPAVSIFMRSIFSLIRDLFLFDETMKFKIWLWKIICF